MNKEFKKDIDYIKYGLKELKDSYELYNKDWAEKLLKEMDVSLQNVLNHIENSIPKEKVEEKIDKFKDETVWKYNDWKYDEKVFHAELNIIDKIKKELLEGK